MILYLEWYAWWCLACACVGDGDGAGLMELEEERPSEWREPVDWYMLAMERLKKVGL